MGNEASLTSSSSSSSLDQDKPYVSKDIVSLILRQDVLSLSDFYHCLLVCRLWRDLCLTDEMWLIRLKCFTEEQYPGRTSWVGYQIIPKFFSEDFPVVGKHGGKTWKNIFQSKRFIKERFDLYTGFGSLLQNLFLEGYFHNGSLVLGTLYDVLYDKPRVVYCGPLRKGMRDGDIGISYHNSGTKAYVGPFRNDFASGLGKTFWKNGLLQYEGNFVNGKKKGYGKQLYATGTYTGEWDNDLPHGRGSWEWKDGTKFIGIMKEGKRDGFGIQLFKNGNVEYEGFWKNDLLNGKCKRYRENGTLDYEGDFVDGLQQGNGTLMRKTFVYEGEFFQSKREGYGTLYDEKKENVVYKGYWKNDLFHGEGTLYRDGVAQSGQFRNGALRGANMDESLTLESSFLSFDDEDGSL